jgi:hypothetical protein
LKDKLKTNWGRFFSVFYPAYKTQTNWGRFFSVFKTNQTNWGPDKKTNWGRFFSVFDPAYMAEHPTVVIQTPDAVNTLKVRAAEE